MAGSTLNPDNFPAANPLKAPPGHDTRTLGPSDSSDSGSDIAGPDLLDDDLRNLERGTNEDSEAGRRNVADAGPSLGDIGMDDNSDRFGTGEHLAAGKDPRIRIGGDIGVDRVVDASEAGLGTGLDQAEEARLGITDQELDKDEDDSGDDRF
jgi:hypothetical protein